MKMWRYLCRNIFKILSQSYLWRKRDLLIKKGDLDTSKYIFKVRYLITKNWGYIIIGSLFSYFGGVLFEEKTLSFLVTIFSIYIGLFVTVLIFSLDKFINIKQNISHEDKRNEVIKIRFVRTENYIKRFTSIILETLLIALGSIVLFFVLLLFNNFFVGDLRKFSPTGKFCEVDVLLTIKVAVIFFVRLVVVVLLLKLVYYILFIISSLGEFIRGLLK